MNFLNIVSDIDVRGFSQKINNSNSEIEALENSAKCVAESNAIMIVTGFIINGGPESDGPIAAMLLAEALINIDKSVSIVCDPISAKIINILRPRLNVISFPIVDDKDTFDFVMNGAFEAIDTCIFIECCGLNKYKKYYSFDGKDISKTSPKFSVLFRNFADLGINTIGICDGGNEIGSGNLDLNIIKSYGVEPCTDTTTFTVFAAASNFGAYALLASLSVLLKRNILPQRESELNLIKEFLSLGGVDGDGGKTTLIDGYEHEINSLIFRQLSKAIDLSISSG